MSKPYVVDGAWLSCTLGTRRSNLIVEPKRKTKASGGFKANIGDSVSMTNIPPFGSCLVSGIPGPCVPSCGMWLGGKENVLIEGLPALMIDSTLLCSTGGVITIDHSGQ